MEHHLAVTVEKTAPRRIGGERFCESLEIRLAANTVVDLVSLVDLFDQPLGIVRTQRAKTLVIRNVIIYGSGRINSIAVARALIDVVNRQSHTRFFVLLERPGARSARSRLHSARCRKVGPSEAERAVFFSGTRRVHADRHIGDHGEIVRSLHCIEVESRADQFDEMLRFHLGHDLACTACRIDHIFGLGIGLVHTLDVEHQTCTVALDHHPADKLFERRQLLAVRQPSCGAQLCHGSRPRLQVIDLAVAIGMRHDDVVILGPVNVALHAVASQTHGVLQCRHRVVRRTAFGGASAVCDDGIGARRRLHESVIDRNTRIGNPAPIGLIGPFVFRTTGESDGQCQQAYDFSYHDSFFDLFLIYNSSRSVSQHPNRCPDRIRHSASCRFWCAR